MSAITEYVRLRPPELTELRRLLADEPDEAYDYAGDLALGDPDEETSSRGMDTDQSWAGLQFLLAKAGAPVDVVGGGAPITDDEWGYDSPRLLDPDEVATAAGFLTGTPFAALAELYDPAELAAADVYPGIWAEDWALSYLGETYTLLVTLFRAAAAAGEPVLIWKS